MQTHDDNLNNTISLAQGGDRAAFTCLVEDHYDLMYRIAYHYCGRQQDAEDITHDACIKLGRSISQFRFESAFSSWLYRLVINCAHDWSRKRKIDSSAEPDLYPAVDPDAEPHILLEQVFREIERMGKGFKETVMLVVGEGRSHAEAATILAVTEGTISWRMHEMRKRLKGIITMEIPA